MTDLKAPTLGRFCHACQAIPVHGYCRLAGCPTAPTDLKAALTDEEAEKMARAHCFANGCASIECNKRGTCACTIHPHEIFAMRTAWLASPGPALRGEGGSSSASLPATSSVATGLWRPIESAPRDGTPVLLLFKEVLPKNSHIVIWQGLTFVGRYHGSDISGWGFAAPVGCGGFPDDWFVGWLPLPEPPASGWPLGGQGATPEDASGMPKDSLPPDVKAAVERVEYDIGVADEKARYQGEDNSRWTATQTADLRTLLKSHIALTEANERLRAEWWRAADHMRSFADLHPEDRTAETEAIIFLARQAIGEGET